MVYSLLTRGIEQELLPFCRDRGIGVTVFNPLAAGLLTGKHSRTEAPAHGTRFQLYPSIGERYWSDANLDAVAELELIAEGAGIKPVALAYRWLAAQKAVDSIVVGASRPEQLQENLSLWEGELSADTLEACERVWAKLKGPSYPYNQ